MANRTRTESDDARGVLWAGTKSCQAFRPR